MLREHSEISLSVVICSGVLEDNLEQKFAKPLTTCKTRYLQSTNLKGFAPFPVWQAVPSPAISIVLPVRNGAETLSAALDSIRGQTFANWELLAVDDGSTDGTLTRLRDVATADSHFSFVALKRNFGQAAALAAGIKHADGDYVVTMDGDLQNDPADIGAMIARLEEGHDVVTGWREDRKDAFVVRKLPSMVANWLVRKLTGASIRDNGCALRVYRAEIIQRYVLYSEMHRLLPTMVSLTGADIVQVRVRHHARQYGESKYGLSRIYKFLFDLAALKTILTLFWLPLFGFGLAGVAFLGLSALALVAGVVQMAAVPGSSLVVPLGSSVLLASLAVFLLILGLICGLIYDTGGGRVEHLLKKDLY